MTIRDFFEPVSKTLTSFDLMLEEESLSGQIEYGFTDKEEFSIAEFDVAIIGVADGKNAIGNAGVEFAPQSIRKVLGSLRKTSRDIRIVDLGNVKGSTLNDRYFALSEVARLLLKYQVVGLVIGGAQDYLMPVIRSLESVDDEMAISFIDSRLDFAIEQSDFSSKTILSFLKTEYSRRIFDLNVLGVQKYFVGQSQEEQMNDLGWGMVRLGDIRNDNIKYTEPYLRDADVVGFDVGAIQNSYMPYSDNINVNGLTGYEACQIAWYSGMSDNLKFFNLHEYNPNIDNDNRGAVLCAQMVWHLLEGISLKISEQPNIESENYKIFVVHLHNFNEDIRFYNNRYNGRWWIEVPWNESVRLLACNESEYEQTQKGNLPDKWWKFFQKGSIK